MILHIFPLKALFCYLKYSWKNFYQGQYSLIHNVHLVNFGQSLSNIVQYTSVYFSILQSHILQSMLNFTMFLANSDQGTIWTIYMTHIVHIKSYKIFIKFHQRLILFYISNAFKKLNLRKYSLTHIVLNIMILICVAFSNLSSKFWRKDNLIWPMLFLF